MSKQYFVYILTNRTNKVLYTGVTSDLIKRVWQHKNLKMSSFTTRYNVNKLVYFEIFNTAYEAISREKQIKAGSRTKKIQLIQSANRLWEDLNEKLV